MFATLARRMFCVGLGLSLAFSFTGIDEAEAGPRVVVRAPAAHIVAPQPRVRVITPRVSVRPVAPGPNYVWVDGYWDCGEWFPGFWQPTYSRAGYVYVRGYWNGVTYVDGYWRPSTRPPGPAARAPARYLPASSD